MNIEHRWARVLGPEMALRVAEFTAYEGQRARTGHMRGVVRALQTVGTCPHHLPAASALVFARLELDPFGFS